MQTGSTSSPSDSAAAGSPRRVSRRDIARAAGVSLATVTYALSDQPKIRVSVAQRAKIRRLAREMNYRPNFIGRALVSGKTFAVGIVLPTPNAIAIYFYHQIIQHLVTAMIPDEYHLMILFRSELDHVLRIIREGRLDGIINLQSDLETVHLDRLAATRLPLVSLNRGYKPPRGAGPVGIVESDHAGLMRSVLDEFQAERCRSLLGVFGNPRIYANTIMLHAYRAELAARAPTGLQGVEATVVAVDPNPDFQPLGILEKSIDGIFVDGLETAERLIEWTAQQGLRVGRDYQLITSEFFSGARSRSQLERCCYLQQPELLGPAAWQTLKAEFNGEKRPKPVRIPYLRVPVQDV